MNGQKINKKMFFDLQIFEGLKREVSFISCLVNEIIGKNRLTITKNVSSCFSQNVFSKGTRIFFIQHSNYLILQMKWTLNFHSVFSSTHVEESKVSHNNNNNNDNNNIWVATRSIKKMKLIKYSNFSQKLLASIWSNAQWAVFLLLTTLHVLL